MSEVSVDGASTPPRRNWADSLRESTALRLGVVGILVLLLMIPLALVDDVARERQNRSFEVTSDIAGSWGPEQQVVGPLLAVPVTMRVRSQVNNADGQPVERIRDVRRTLIVPPEDSDMTIELTHENRKRSLYTVPVYTADIRIDASFARPEISKLQLGDTIIHWDQALLVVTTSDVRRVLSASITSNGSTADLESGDALPGVAGTPMVAPFDFAETGIQAELALTVRGTQSISTPLIGRSSKLSLESSWPHPSFFGHLLPESYEAAASGTTALWRAGGIARGLPTGWIAGEERSELRGGAVGMRLFDPVTPYTLIDRGMKYGVLFIALTFVLVVALELLTGRSLHIAQYAVIGLGIAVFFQVLLALSEHIGFGGAYASATLILTAMMTWYASAVTESRALGLAMGLVQLATYGVLYVLLQLDTYALLAGTALVLLAFGLIMFATRRLGGQLPNPA